MHITCAGFFLFSILRCIVSNSFRVVYYIQTVAGVVSISLVWNRLFNTDDAINNMLNTIIGSIMLTGSKE